MSEPTVIPLHTGTPPSMGQVVGWVIAANIFVVTTTAVVFVVLPWTAGHQPTLDGRTIGLASVVGIGLMIGFLFVAFRRHRRRGLGVASAELRLTDENATLVRDGESFSCARDELEVRPVHAHETLRGVDYYMGPAIELTIAADTWVIGLLDGGLRWSNDPPAVSKIDWICNFKAWSALLMAEDMLDLQVPYRDRDRHV